MTTRILLMPDLHTISGIAIPSFALPDNLQSSGFITWWIIGTILLVLVMLILMIAILRRSRYHERALAAIDIQRKIVIDNLSDAIVLMSPVKSVIQANQAALDLYGKTSDEIVGLQCFEIFPECRKQHDLCPLNNVLKNGIRHNGIFDTADGRILKVTAAPIMDERGRVSSVIKTTSNITRQHLSEAIIKQEQQILNMAMEVAGAGWFVWNLSENSFIPGQSWHDIFSFCPNEKIGFEELMAQNVHPTDLDLVSAVINHFKDGQQPESELDFRVNSSKDGIRWIHMLIRTLEKDMVGKPVKAIGLMRDISQEKQRRDSSRKAAELQNSVEEATKDGLWSWRLQDDSLSINDTFLSLLCLKRNQNDIKWESVRNIMHSHDRKGFDSFAEKIQIGNMDEVSVDCRLKINAETYNWFRLRGRCLKKDELGRPLLAAGSIINIQVAKKRELVLLDEQEKFQMVMENSAIGAWEWNLDDDSIIVSDSWIRITEYPKREFRLEEWQKVVNPDDFQVMLSVLRDILANKLPLFQVELRVKHPRKGWIWLRNVGKIDVSESCSYKRILGYIMDITSEKKREQEIIEAKEKAEKSDQLKSVFLANISHEIRTPLNAIIGFNALALSDDLSFDDRTKYTALIDRNCDKLLSIISNIVDMAILESGNVQLKMQPNNITAILRDEFRAFEQELKLLGNGKVSCALKIDEKTDNAIVICDELRVRQILFCLLDNALKFTKEGSITLGCRITSDNKVSINIQDTGVGMSKEKLSVIFEPFRQGDDRFCREFGGLGIGLSLSSKLADLMGGRVRIESEIGKGTVSYLEFDREMPGDLNSDQPSALQNQ